jgi:hypothetical protein
VSLEVRLSFKRAATSAAYIDFVGNHKYPRRTEAAAGRPAYVISRYLDPGNPRSARKNFYNPNVVTECDKFYTRIATATP